MSKLDRPVAVRPLLAVLVLIAVASGGILIAKTPQRLRAFAGAPAAELSAEPLTEVLPSVVRRTMTVLPAATDTPILSFDDGTCESGLGAGTTMHVTDFVDFDVPTQCIQAGLEIIGVTTRLNTGMPISTFAFAQAGATPPPAGSASLAPIAPIPAFGPCPATSLATRAIEPGAAIITGTSNFFAGVRAAGFVGRDTNGPPAGRIWLNCSFCGMTQYSPTTLTNLGLGGNWMIRVTVENPPCIPVELMEFVVRDG